MKEKKYTITHLADALGMGRETLRYYEQAQLVTPVRDEKNGYRYYTETDGLNALRVKMLQAMGLRVCDMAQEPPVMNARAQKIDLLEQEDERLADEIALLQEKRARLRVLRRFLSEAKQSDSCVREEDTYGVYKLDLLGAGVEKSDARHMASSQWLKSFPFCDIGWEIEKSAYESGQALLDAKIGLSVLPRYADRFLINISPPVRFFPAGRSARIMVAVTDPFHVPKALFTPLFDYAKGCQKNVLSNITGRFSGCEDTAQGTMYWFSARILIG